MVTTFADNKEQLLKQAEEKLLSSFDDQDNYSIQQKIALTCRMLYEHGHGAGVAGQITARGEQPGTYYTQRFGLAFDEIKASNLLLVNEDLEVLEGKGMPNPANRFHSWVYRARPDAQCIIHTHAMYTAALSQLEQPLVISHMDNCLLYDDVEFVGAWPGVPFGNEDGDMISKALNGKRALMMAHHGLLVAGGSVEEACMLAITFEQAARIQLMSMAAGEIKPIDPQKGRQAHDWLIKPKHTKVAFFNLARRVLDKHPGCLD